LNGTAKPGGFAVEAGLPASTAKFLVRFASDLRGAPATSGRPFARWERAHLYANPAISYLFLQ